MVKIGFHVLNQKMIKIIFNLVNFEYLILSNILQLIIIQVITFSFR